MPSTLNPACPLCGLQYANRPLLELHIREDHPQRNRPPDQATKETITMTATQPPGPPRPGWTRTALRRALGRLKSLSDEFARGNEALFHSMRAPWARTRPEAPAGKDSPAA